MSIFCKLNLPPYVSTLVIAFAGILAMPFGIFLIDKVRLYTGFSYRLKLAGEGWGGGGNKYDIFCNNCVIAPCKIGLSVEQ